MLTIISPGGIQQAYVEKYKYFQSEGKWTEEHSEELEEKLHATWPPN